MAAAIRPAHRPDLPAILQLIRALAEYERLGHEVEATEEKLGLSLFPADGSAPAAHCLLAEIGHETAGFALYLEDLFVKPEFRGRGLGKALLLHLAKLANARGCGRMEWTVLDWNKPAIEFYESLGAQRRAEWQLCRLSGDALRRYA